MAADVEMRWGLQIPLRDGIRLSATAYLPRGSATAAPALFLLTPYMAQEGHERGLYFAAHGYPFLAIDTRGRGNSEGEFAPFIQEAQDGCDIVEWIAKQPYCDGRVAMCGGSYCGYAQWVTATQFPAHLATMVPTASSFLGHDVWMRNNICYPYLMQWLTLVSGRASQDKIFWGNDAFWTARFREWFESGQPFSKLDTIVGNPSAIFQEWIAQPMQGPYWDRYNPTAEEYSRLTLPILSITGMYDSDQPGALTHYREHVRNASAESASRHYLVIGPWHHGGMRKPSREFAGARFGDASLLDIYKLHLDWYNWTLRGGPRPEFLRNNVAYYVTGAEEWRYADSLDAVTADVKSLYLSSCGNAAYVFASGTLGESTGDGCDTYVYDPRDLSIASFESQSIDPLCLRPTFPTENLADQSVLLATEGRRLIYHSAPFTTDTLISGFFRLSAWISIDQPDTDFLVCIYEIDGNGASTLLTADSMRARYRESLRQEKLVRTTDPLQYDFASFTFVARMLKRGSRLRLVIGPVHSIHYQKNYNSGGIVAEESMECARPVTVRLFHDPPHPSILYVPVGR
jgi:uncharacterized protein